MATSPPEGPLTETSLTPIKGRKSGTRLVRGSPAAPANKARFNDRGPTQSWNSRVECPPKDLFLRAVRSRGQVNGTATPGRGELQPTWTRSWSPGWNLEDRRRVLPGGGSGVTLHGPANRPGLGPCLAHSGRGGGCRAKPSRRGP